MARIKEIYMEILEKYGDVEATEELFEKYLKEREKEKESK